MPVVFDTHDRHVQVVVASGCVVQIGLCLSVLCACIIRGLSKLFSTAVSAKMGFFWGVGGWVKGASLVPSSYFLDYASFLHNRNENIN